MRGWAMEAASPRSRGYAAADPSRTSSSAAIFGRLRRSGRMRWWFRSRFARLTSLAPLNARSTPRPHSEASRRGNRESALGPPGRELWQGFRIRRRWLANCSERQSDQRRERLRAGLVHDGRAMVLNRALADAEIDGDVLAGLTGKHKVQDLALARCEAG